MFAIDRGIEFLFTEYFCTSKAITIPVAFMVSEFIPCRPFGQFCNGCKFMTLAREKISIKKYKERVN